MKVLFLDDSKQRNCRRERMGELVAVGGIFVDEGAARALDREIERICVDEFQFPNRAPFKWSPDRRLWMRDNLVGDRREAFFRRVLETAAEAGAQGQVMICDSAHQLANRVAANHEIDALIMSLERFDRVLAGGTMRTNF